MDIAFEGAEFSGEGSDVGKRASGPRSGAEPLFREFLEGTSDCVCLINRDWRFTYLNQRAIAEVAGGRDLIGASMWDAFPALKDSPFEDHYRRAMSERTDECFDAYFPPLDAWYEVHASPLADGGLGVWFRNINRQRQAEENRRLAEERYRLAARATNDLVWDWDLATDEVSWNEARGERFGYPHEALGTHISWWEDHIHPDDRERARAAFKAAVDGDERYAAEYRFRKGDGTYADVYDRGFLIRGADGALTRMVGAMQDHSERNQAVAALRERESQLALIFGQAMVGVMHSGVDGKVMMVNKRFCEIVGRSEEELKASAWLEYTHPDDLVWNKPLFKKHAASGEPVQMEKRYIRRDGSIVWCAVHISFVRSVDGISSCIAIIDDISVRRAAETEAESQKMLLQNIVDSVSDLIFVKNRDGRFSLTNRALQEGCGFKPGDRPSDFYRSEMLRDDAELDREVMATREPRALEELIPVHGEQRLFQTIKVPWMKGGEVAGVIGVSRDITERKQAEQALKESELLHRSVLEASVDTIKIMDLDGRIELMNASGLSAIEIEDFETVRGKNWASLWPVSARPAVTAAIAKARAGAVAHVAGACPTAKGLSKWWDVVVTPMKDEAGRVTRLLAISRDTTASRDTSEKLRWASEHDALTMLPNRGSFQTHLQAATIRAMESGQKVGLLLIDLDHFKHINDTLGHAAGDHLLKVLGKRLKNAVRGDDFVARLGGDEFAIVLQGANAQGDLVAAGNAIIRRLQGTIHLGGRALSAGASIGGAIFPEDAATANELFNNADTALYALKASGRGGTKMFHGHMREQAQKVASQLSLARMALSRRSVVPYYQPKVRLGSGEIAGFEALLRWEHPEQGIQLPETVAEAFKDYELASKIGELMQIKVIEDIMTWERDGVAFGHISINAAPAEFLRDDYAEHLLGRLAERCVSPGLIEVEVTEQVFLERGSEYVARALKLLNAAGVRISLDDFGTGYSSLSHLRDFPVDVVKIDQSFVGKMVENGEMSAIVSAVINLADSLSIEVVAEGVETQEQCDILAGKGCTIGQGYLFGKAAAADQVRIMVGRQRRAA